MQDVLKADVFLSSEIDKGKNWFNTIRDQLRDCRIGIAVVTARSAAAAWLLFESGALAAGGRADNRKLCTLLVGVTPDDLPEPLRHFQATLPTKADVHALLRSMNAVLEATNETTLNKRFREAWSDFKNSMDDLLNWSDEEQVPALEMYERLDFTFEQTSRDQLLWVASVEEKFYDDDAIPLEKLQEWFDANASGFTCVHLKRFGIIGSVDILPLREDPLQQLLQGKIREIDLTADDIYTPSERKNIRSIYVESLAFREPDDKEEIRRMAVRDLLKRSVEIVSRICDPDQIETVYALGATAAGERFVDNLGFADVVHGAKRKDHHTFWAASYSALRERFDGMRREDEKTS